jgi:hypothetical protein
MSAEGSGFIPEEDDSRAVVEFAKLIRAVQVSGRGKTGLRRSVSGDDSQVCGGDESMARAGESSMGMT